MQNKNLRPCSELKKFKCQVIKSTKLKRVAHLKNMKKPFQNNIFIPTHLREAEETMLPLFAHCVQLFQKEMFISGPSTCCETAQTHQGHSNQQSSIQKDSYPHHEMPSLSSLMIKIKKAGFYFNIFSLFKGQISDFSGEAQLTQRLTCLLFSAYSVLKWHCHMHPRTWE